MDAAKKLFKFATECEDMAKSAYSEHDQAAWREMAQRWRQCAETSGNHSAALTNGLEQKRQRPRSRAGRLFRPDQDTGPAVLRNGLEALDCVSTALLPRDNQGEN